MAPAIVAVLPALAMLGLAFLSGDDISKIPFIILGAGGLVVTGFVRDRGKSLEPGLWQSWGGAPTTQRLRFKGASDIEAVAVLHERFATLTGKALPDERQEASDPTAADTRYDEAVRLLRVRTRDADKFKLLFSENCDYGSRRNSLGLKPFALPIALLAGLASGAVLAEGVGESGFDAGRWIIACAVSAILALYWIFVVTRDWVHKAGERYTDQLIEALVDLTTPAAASAAAPGPAAPAGPAPGAPDADDQP